MIGITMGDSGGVGPELILKAYKSRRLNREFILIGDYEILDYCNELLNYQVPLRRITKPGDYTPEYLNVMDLGLMDKESLEIGKLSKASGSAALKYVEKATRLALDGQIDAIVTLPINKEATQLSYENFSGHTEFIAEMCGQDNYTMMLASEKLIVTHVSTHVSMLEAIRNVRKDRVYNVIRLTNDALKGMFRTPRIAVAGLNPHAGEGGLFGKEELEQIKPAVVQAQREGIFAEGPIAPDTVFLRALKKQYDAVVCMYHDQGHIPLKLLDFEGGVNVTLGLRLIRTSVDHGTAFDIAYKGVASEQSLVAAFQFADRMIKGRQAKKDC